MGMGLRRPSRGVAHGEMAGVAASSGWEFQAAAESWRRGCPALMGAPGKNTSIASFLLVSY